MNKKGKMSTAFMVTSVTLIVILLILFNVLATVVPLVQTSGNQLNNSQVCANAGGVYNGTFATGLECRNQSGAGSSLFDVNYVPLGGLFNSTGVVPLIIMAGILLVILIGVLKHRK